MKSSKGVGQYGSTADGAQGDPKAYDIALTPVKEIKRHRTLGAVLRNLFVALSIIGIVFSIHEVFRIGAVFYHEHVYYYGMIGIFLGSSFLLFPATSRAAEKKLPWYDVLLFILTISCAIYLMKNAYRIADEGWVFVGPPSSTVVSILLWGLVLEALRRTGGMVLFLFAGFFSFYPLFAEYMPGFLEGAGWSLPGAAMFHAMTKESIIGIPTRVFCELLIGFMVFGETLKATGGAEFFINFAFGVLGHVRGGGAKVAVVASALFGTMSGSAISNVVTTGTMTIPTMKRVGYPGYFAGAVEACASSGGCIMPPVMGAVAFVMASILQVPYGTVAIAALIPALLYFWGLFVQIDAYAAKTGLAGLPRNELPSLKATAKKGWVNIFALLTLIYLLFYLKREAQAPFYASIVLLAGAALKKETRPNLKTIYNIILNSGKILAEMLGMLAGIGLILGGLSMTGVAVSFSSEVVNLIGNHALAMLLMGALTSFILGMGMTITACYIFLAIVLIPALTPFNFDIFAVHLFVIYCGLFSFITPPVAIGAYAAASIAGSNPWRTGIQSMRLGFVKYLIPFLFVYNPALILHGKTVLGTLEAVATAFLGVFVLGSCLEGYLPGLGRLNFALRMLFGAIGLMLFVPERSTDLIGLAILAAMFAGRFLIRRYRKSAASGIKQET